MKKRKVKVGDKIKVDLENMFGRTHGGLHDNGIVVAIDPKGDEHKVNIVDDYLNGEAYDYYFGDEDIIEFLNQE